MDGALRTGDLAKAAADMGMPAIAITDHGNMFGAIEFCQEAKKNNVKPIIGCEVYLSPGSRFDKNNQKDTYHLVLLVKDETGYKNLIELVSRGYIEGFYYRMRIDKELLWEYHDGLIALSACIQGEVPALLIEDQIQQAKKSASELNDIFGSGNFYLELQYHSLPKEKKVIPDIIKLAKELNIPLVATNDCHYLSKADSEAHEVMLAIQTGKTINDQDRLKFGTDEFYFRSPEEMKKLFLDYSEAIKNTVEIAEKCQFKPLSDSVLIPDYDLPQGFSNADEYIEFLCRKGLPERYSQITSEIEERLQYELSVIKKTGFAPFFLYARDIVQFARSHGIRVGPGRGSGAASLVAYAIGITNIDPIRHGLVFERFLNLERVTPPDFDLDFDADRRGEVVKYIIDRFGKDRVAQIITFNRMTARAVIRDVGRALGMPLSEVDKIAKLIPNELGITLDKAVESVPELKNMTENKEIGKLFRIARSLEGMARNASVHAAGVVIFNDKASKYVPLFKTGNDEIVVQYDKMILEKIGINKFDILGLDALTMIENAIKLIEENHNVKIDLDKIPLDDKATYDLLCQARTLGIFQLGGQGMVDLLLRLQPRTFEELIPIVSLYRPGPIESGMLDEYVGRKQGTIPIEYLHPLLEPILKDTFGTIIYQEQVMKIGREIAGFTLGQADLLRRAMGKKIPEELERQRIPFLEGARAKGISEEIAQSVFEQLIPFAGYGFNQSHTTVYALITYQTAYLKAHYPVEFMAAGMTREKDNSAEVVKYIKESQKMGIEILPPDINESYANFTVHGNSIRFGLGAIKNVGDSAIESIISAREEKGPFHSIFNFCERVDLRAVNRKCIESLIKCGAFDSCGGHRAQLLAVLDTAMQSGQKVQKDKLSGQVSLFDTFNVVSTAINSLPDVPKIPDSQILAMEKEMLGFYISGHPLTRFSGIINKYSNASSSKLCNFENGCPVTLIGMISSIRRRITRNEKQMAFVTLDDLEGTVELVIFSETLTECSEKLKENNIVWVKGVVSKNQVADNENVCIRVNELALIDELKERKIKSIHVNIPLDISDTSVFHSLKNICLKNKGECSLFLHLTTPKFKEIVIQTNPDIKVSSADSFIFEVEQLFGEKTVWLDDSGSSYL